MMVYGITYDHTTNYGSCLQAYALQTAIGQIRINGENCRYSLIPIRTFRTYPKPGHGWVKLAIALMNKRNKLRFRGFEEERMHYAPVRSFRELSSLNASANAFVCGSDVIWRPDLNFGLGAFYLDFAKKYAFSYAASFGISELDDAVRAFAAPKIAALREIGVREQNAADLVREWTGREAEVVADPVLLLDVAEWNKLAAKPDGKTGEIFVYATHPTPALEETARTLQATVGLPVDRNIWTRGIRDYLREGAKKMKSPDRWLQRLRDADYVVTNSFHATVFSILFHKKFFTVVNGELQEGANIRMFDLLSRLGLSDRIVNEVPRNILLDTPDFTTADREIAVMREDSVAFLRRNLEAAAEEAVNNKEGVCA